jgi:hypothetical protein
MRILGNFNKILGKFIQILLIFTKFCQNSPKFAWIFNSQIFLVNFTWFFLWVSYKRPSVCLPHTSFTLFLKKLGKVWQSLKKKSLTYPQEDFKYCIGLSDGSTWDHKKPYSSVFYLQLSTEGIIYLKFF